MLGKVGGSMPVRRVAGSRRAIGPVVIGADPEDGELVVAPLRGLVALLPRSTSMTCRAPKRWPVR